MVSLKRVIPETNGEEQTVVDWVREAIADELPCDVEEVLDTSTLREMGADSMDVHAFLVAVEEEFNINTEGVDVDNAYKMTVKWWGAWITYRKDKRKPVTA